MKYPTTPTQSYLGLEPADKLSQILALQQLTPETKAQFSDEFNAASYETQQTCLGGLITIAETISAEAATHYQSQTLKAAGEPTQLEQIALEIAEGLSPQREDGSHYSSDERLSRLLGNVPAGNIETLMQRTKGLIETQNPLAQSATWKELNKEQAAHYVCHRCPIFSEDAYELEVEPKGLYKYTAAIGYVDSKHKKIIAASGLRYTGIFGEPLLSTRLIPHHITRHPLGIRFSNMITDRPRQVMELMMEDPERFHME